MTQEIECDHFTLELCASASDIRKGLEIGIERVYQCTKCKTPFRNFTVDHHLVTQREIKEIMERLK